MFNCLKGESFSPTKCVLVCMGGVNIFLRTWRALEVGMVPAHRASGGLRRASSPPFGGDLPRCHQESFLHQERRGGSVLPISGLYEVAIRVKSLPRAETFYRDILGLEVAIRDPKRPM